MLVPKCSILILFVLYDLVKLIACWMIVSTLIILEYDYAYELHGRLPFAFLPFFFFSSYGSYPGNLNGHKKRSIDSIT